MAGAVAGQAELGSAQSAKSWSTFHGNTARDGATSLNGPTTDRLEGLWHLNVPITASPVLDSAGVAYVGDHAGTVYALDPAKPGVAKWTFKTAGSIEEAATLSSDGSKLFVGSDDGNVYALNTANGQKVWSVSFGAPVEMSPLLSSDGGTVYIADITGTLQALKTADGSLSWKASEGVIRGNLAESPDGSTIYFASVAGTVVGLPASGSGSGSVIFYLDGSPVSSPSVDTIGNLYITTSAGSLMSFPPGGGAARWTFAIPSQSRASSTPAIGGGNVYFGASNGNMYAVNQQNGQLVWQQHVPQSIQSSPAVSTGSHLVYFGANNGTVYADGTSDGTPLWARVISAQVIASPAVGLDGSLWEAGNDGTVVRFHEIAAPSTPPAFATSTPGLAPTATITPTSIPAATATVTATSAPTATSTPAAPPLSASLKGKVKPGAKQSIVIHSVAAAQVRIRVDYPNGDHQSKKITLRASGTATYSYTQGASKVTHNKFKATVTLTVGSGASATTITKQYSIAWAAIDVSAEPRSQSVNKKVNIFVHTGVRRVVNVYLLFPNGRLLTRHGTTGPKGLAHIGYKVAPGMISGSKRKVIVIARLANSPRVATKTTFTIK